MIMNNLPEESSEAEKDKQQDTETNLYKNMYGKTKWLTEAIFTIFNAFKTLIIWICYVLILIVLIHTEHSIKNWISAILLIYIIYKHLSASVYSIYGLWIIFSTYSGFVFISTWVYQFLKFPIILHWLGIKSVENVPINGKFWGYTVLTEEQLLFRVIALSSLLVLSVLGSRSLSSIKKK
jgi:cellulose synthase/poly-beta-1,6-N-acetylglucosamine synthase-like glycosyltransferase